MNLTLLKARGTTSLFTKGGEIELSNVLYIPSISKSVSVVGSLANEGKAVVFTKLDGVGQRY